MSAETGLTCEVWVNFYIDNQGTIAAHPSMEHADSSRLTRLVGYSRPYRVLIPVPAEVVPPTIRATVEEVAP